MKTNNWTETTNYTEEIERIKKENQTMAKILNLEVNKMTD